MKNFSIFLFIALTSILASFTSCSSDSEAEPLEEKARYYVKYEVNSKWGYRITANQKITYTTENGVENYSQEGKSVSSFEWEGSYGPFEKGDIVSLSISNSTMDIHARIYVSRDKEPFVIKAEGSQQKSLTLQYKIDF